MKQENLTQKLKELLRNWENETVEFKRGKSSFSTEEIARYFSALSNEANLRGISSGWLVFGIDNDSRTPYGTEFRPDEAHLQSIKHQMIQMTNFSFIDVVAFEFKEKRVIMFEIPPAPQGIPVSCNGHYYARQGESLVALDDIKRDSIRAQIGGTQDWTAQPVKGATLDDLDPAALRFGKKKYIAKTKWVAEGNDIELSDEAFLKRVRLMSVDNKITRAAIILLGKEESAALLSPNPVEITWRLMGENTAFEHFYPPFLLTSTKLYERIRVIQIRLLPKNKMVKVEVPNYTMNSILEVLNNCIAHQDYSMNARIVVTEYPDRLLFENAGNFYEQHPLDYFTNDQIVAMRYRNTCLANAMVSLDMIERSGFGIRQVFYTQVDRYLPLPSYDERPESVVVNLYGAPIDSSYTELLLENYDLSPDDLVALDAIQKGQIPDTKTLNSLKNRGFVGGRKPNYTIIPNKADRNDDVNDYALRRKVIDYVSSTGSASRADIENLISSELADLSTEASEKKVNAVMTALKREGVIHNIGSRKSSKWVIVEK
jgi:ATP-dependent DNA helicase RecG